MRYTFCAVLLGIFLSPFATSASQTIGTILPPDLYAWSTEAGWVNFGATNSSIEITDTGITGYAWSDNYGWIHLAPNNGGVVVAANGALSGYAWSTALGWIDFSGVSISAEGNFVGQATGPGVGMLVFDCTNCVVSTDYVPADFRSAQVVVPPTAGGGIPELIGMINQNPTAPGTTTPASTTTPGDTTQPPLQVDTSAPTTQIPLETQPGFVPGKPQVSPVASSVHTTLVAIFLWALLLSGLYGIARTWVRPNFPNGIYSTERRRGSATTPQRAAVSIGSFEK